MDVGELSCQTTIHFLGKRFSSVVGAKAGFEMDDWDPCVVRR